MDGVLVIDKPGGLTSHDVVARVRSILHQRRVGHTGTLDPFATGVLVLLIGGATRLAQFLSGAEKEYEAVIRLGYATDTGDITGARVQEQFTTETQRCAEIRREEIECALASLRGEIEQTPPMYSAKKVGGRKLYELARRGLDVERKTFRVIVSRFEPRPCEGLWLRENQDGTCDLKVRVVCSAGTYIRALAEEFGKRLGVGAHVASLRRTRAGGFKIENAVTLGELDELVKLGKFSDVLVSPDRALSGLPFVHLSVEDARRARHGIDLPARDADARKWADGQLLRLRNADGLIAVGIYDQERSLLHPLVVIAADKR